MLRHHSHCISGFFYADVITKPSWDLLLDEVPAFERYFRILIQDNLIATQRRLMRTMTTTAEERYQKLLQDFPDIV